MNEICSNIYQYFYFILFFCIWLLNSLQIVYNYEKKKIVGVQNFQTTYGLIEVIK